MEPDDHGSWKYVLEGGNYELPSLSLTGSEKMQVKNDSVLYVRGNVNISGDIQIFSLQPTKTFR